MYNAGNKVGPPNRRYIVVNYDEVLAEAKRKNFLWMLTRMHNSQCQTVSSWTGFNIQVHCTEDTKENCIEYLPTINAPATYMSTLHDILVRSETIRKSLQLKSIVCVFDQALYAKASEIKWKNLVKFGDIVIRMGAFHTSCTLLAILGKRFGDAGLRELAIEIGIIEDGSISGVLEGRQYNRAIRMHKLTYEALNRLAWDSFVECVGEKEEIFEELSECIEEMSNCIDTDTFHETLSKSVYMRVANLFDEHQEFLKKENGDLSALWMSYIDMVGVMLDILRASREGNWQLHLASIKTMIPWCFAYDKVNYARYLSAYYQEMVLLPETQPEVHEYMTSGGFCVQMGQLNPFGRIPVDQAVEETVNKDTQTAGGTKGFSLKDSALQRYYITAEYRTQFLRNMREMICLNESKLDHPDLSKPRIALDESQVTSIVDILSNSWMNPFKLEEQDLASLSSGISAPDSLRNDLLEAYNIGNKEYETFKKRLSHENTNVPKFHDKITRCNLKTFASLENKSKIVKSKNSELMLRANRNLFAHIVLVAENRNLQMEEVLQHPLGPLPWSLATCDGLMRKTNKAALGNSVAKDVLSAEMLLRPHGSLIDGMALVQKMKCDNKTFAEIASAVLVQALREASDSVRTDIVFDVYQNISIKSAERAIRGDGSGIRFTSLAPGHKMKQWRAFLKMSDNKNKLIQFLVEQWKGKKTRATLGNKTLYVTCGQECFKLTKDVVEPVHELQCNHEEADTRLLFHAAHMSRSNLKAIVIHAEDTDVRLICIANVQNIRVPMFQRRGTQNRIQFISITNIYNIIGHNVALALPGLHSFTGCDTTSAFAGKGKLSALKILKGSVQFQQLFQTFGNDWHLSEDKFEELEEFTCLLYGSKNGTKDVNVFRHELFCAKKGNIESFQLPPCKDTLHKHAQRACYQAAIWKSCLDGMVELPSPVNHGWEIEDGELVMDWMDGSPAPEAVVALLACNCRRKCTLPTCTCLSNSMKCTQLCKLQRCSNQVSEEDEYDD